jgi:hypothetical protein
MRFEQTRWLCTWAPDPSTTYANDPLGLREKNRVSAVWVWVLFLARAWLGGAWTFFGGRVMVLVPKLRRFSGVSI